MTALDELVAQLSRARTPIMGELAPAAAPLGVQQIASYVRPDRGAAAAGALGGSPLGGGGSQLVRQALSAGPRVTALGGAAPAAARVMTAADLAAQVPGAARAITVADLGLGMAAGAPAAGRAAGLGAKLRSAMGLGAGGATLSRGALMRAGGWAGAGLLAGSLEDKLVGEHSGTSWDEAGTGALTGAGIGAGIGSVVPVIGTGVGALAGGLAGGVVGLLGPKSRGETPTNEELARQLAAVDRMALSAGLDQDARTQLGLQLQAARQTANSKDQVKQLSADLQMQIPQLTAQATGQRKQEMQALMMQAMTAPFLQKYLDRSASSARESQTVLNDAAARLPAPLAELYRARGANLVSDADSANAAMAAQIANMPNQRAVDLQRQLEAQVQQQLLARAASAAAGSGSGTSLDALLAGR